MGGASKKQAYMRLADELYWVPEATDKELDDELCQLDFDCESIKSDLFSYRYTDKNWRPRAQIALSLKKRQIEIIQNEVDRRDETKSKNLVKDKLPDGGKSKSYWSEMNHYKRLLDDLKKKGDILKHKTQINSERQENLIRSLRKEVGEDRFREIAKEINNLRGDP